MIDKGKKNTKTAKKLVDREQQCVQSVNNGSDEDNKNEVRKKLRALGYLD